LDPKFQDALTKGAVSPSQAAEMSRLSIEGQWKLWQAIRSGQCETYVKLRRLARAIHDAENQGELFKKGSPTEKERQALAKVDAFIRESGRLLDMITEDDLKVKAALLTNVAKQQAAKSFAA
jgi:hypothetical protein